MRRVRLPQPLGEAEKRLFAFILNSVRHLDVTLRVAGGWVRDRMLNRAGGGDDIDIAIETAASRPYVTGEQLAQAIADATGTDQHPTVSVIKTNPDKSKHIETAQVTIMGFPLEFCHLRKDDYTKCSPVQRTPTVAVATPLEDAERRDFRCNALFYNLHTGDVEDFVGGLDDIADQRLRCPLDPTETFHDDPLRMLRCVRFAGKLGFTIDDSIVASILSGTPHNEPFFTHEAAGLSLRPLTWELLRKVSRERCGIETGKMFTGRASGDCAVLLARLGLLYSAVVIEMHPARRPRSTPHVPQTFERIVPLLAPAAWDECFARTQPLLRAALGPELGLQDADRLVATLFALLAAPLVLMNPLSAASSHASGAAAAAAGADAAPPAHAVPGATTAASRRAASQSSASAAAAARRDELSKRVEAVVQHALKQPRRVAEEVAWLVCALDALVHGSSSRSGTHGSLVDAAAQAVRGGMAAQATAVVPIRDELRAGIFFALRAVRQSSRSVTLAFVHVFAAAACADEQQAALFVRSLLADEPLFTSGALQPLLRGDDLRAPHVLPQMPLSNTADALTVQLQFMVDNPRCTEQDAAAYLRFKFPEWAAAPAQPQQQ